MAGLAPTVAVDRDPVLSSAHAVNFPECELFVEDLAAVPASAILSLLPGGRSPVAVLGGPPCQGFSRIGRRQRDDPRNTLLHLYFEMVAQLRPKFFMMENVPGLSDRHYRPVLDAALESVGARYRVLEPVIMNAGDFGAATSRPRLVVIGYDPNEVDTLDPVDLLAAVLPNRPTVADALDGLPGPQLGGWGKVRRTGTQNTYAIARGAPPPPGVGDARHLELFSDGLVSGFQPTAHSEEVVTRFGAVLPGKSEPISRYHRLAWDRPAQVLRAGTGSDRGSFQAARPIHPNEPRVITVREAARLQGFPDWFAFHVTKWHSHRMIGNSVSPPFAAALLSIMAAKCGEGVSAQMSNVAWQTA